MGIIEGILNALEKTAEVADVVARATAPDDYYRRSEVDKVILVVVEEEH